MACGIGEASALLSIINTAAISSKAIISIASKYKDAREQIQAFGCEVSILGKLLDQLHRRLSNPSWTVEEYVKLLTDQIIDECINIFTQLDTFKDNLYAKPADLEPSRVSLKGTTKWVFKSTELEFLRARMDSMKINMVLIMAMAMPQRQEQPSAESNSEKREHVKQIQMLTAQSNTCLERLESLEQRLTVDDNFSSDDTNSVATFQTTRTSQTIRDNLLQLSRAMPCALELGLTDNLPPKTAIGIDDSLNTSDLVERFLQQQEEAASACAENDLVKRFLHQQDEATTTCSENDLVERLLDQQDEAATACSENEQACSRPEREVDLSTEDDKTSSSVGPYRLKADSIAREDLQKGNGSKLRFIFCNPEAGILEAKSSIWYHKKLATRMADAGDQQYGIFPIPPRTLIDFQLYRRGAPVENGRVQLYRYYSVDLSKLGYAIAWRRYVGQIKHLVVEDERPGDLYPVKSIFIATFS
ncbi:MAG: hypothetical protein FRX48_01454 [Lasallia pustulata]|uniref:Fungal N-terminal domain-containing protein n=1 Tax=Lasallia pustulata TaxID=136370 RepID=A0A5M8Q155_9LECA|nr:MAG: hypothetical protein FRX48_01454 [Lasallia pustulata]